MSVDAIVKEFACAPKQALPLVSMRYPGGGGGVLVLRLRNLAAGFIL